MLAVVTNPDKPVVAERARPERQAPRPPVARPRQVVPAGTPARLLATILGVSSRSIWHWRAGTHRPRWSNRRKLHALDAVLRQAARAPS